MIELVVFDLDGVLIDSKEIHFDALNLALAEVGDGYVISRNEQDTVFEGLTLKLKVYLETYTRKFGKKSKSTRPAYLRAPLGMKT